VANLTITVDEEVLKRARMRALAQGTSVNAILAAYLEAYADQQARQQEATRALLATSRKVPRAAEVDVDGLETSFMSDRVFLDSNVLVDLFDADTPDSGMI